MTMIHFTKSLRFKVTLLVITVELLIFSGVGVFYTHRFSQEIDKAIIARLSIPGLLMTRGDLSFDAVSDKRTMEGLLREPYIEGIVISLDGQVDFSSNPARLETHLDAIDGLRLPAPESSAFSADAPDLITPVQDNTGTYLTCLSPLRPDGKLTGYLFLKVGTGISEAEKRNIATLFAIGSLVTIALTAPILSLLLHLMVIRRLNDLVEIFRRFARGDYGTRAHPLGAGDEITTLMDGFNGLATRLEDTMANLNESESRFRVLVEHAPEAILVYDVDTKRFVDANQNAERLFACSLEQLRLSSPTDFFTPVLTDKKPAEEGIDEYLHRALAGEEVVVERAIINATGRQLLCEVRLVLLPAGNRRLIRASYIDITERKRAEEALIKSEERMRLYFERQLVGMAITSPEKRWIQVNDKLCKMLGYEPDELARLTWEDLTHPDDLATDVAYFERLLAGEIHDYTLGKRFIRKDGTILYANLSVGCVRTETGAVDYLLALLEDISERKRAEIELRQSERRYRDIFESSPVGIFRSTLDGKFLSVNPAVARMLKYDSPDDMIRTVNRTSIAEALYVDPSHRREVIESVLGHNDWQIFEERFRCKDGSIIICNFHYRAVPGLEGDDPREFEGFVVDITESTHAKNASRASEERYHHVLDTMLEGFQIIDYDWRYVYVNETAARQGHFSKEALTGHSMMEMFPGIDTTDMFRTLRTCMESRVPSRMENKFIYPNDDIAWFELSIQPSEEGIFILSTDVTEHMRAEEALRESEEKFRVLAETSPTAIIVYQGEHFVYVNPSAVRLFGYSETELLEMNFWEWAHPDHREMIINNGMARQRGEYVADQYELRFIKKNGEEGWVIVSAGSIEYQGKPAGIATFVDITEPKRAEARIHAALAEKDVLLKEVHHRVKNNLQIISTLLDLQSDSICDEHSLNAFRESQDRIRAMALVHETLYQSKDLASIDFAEYIEKLAGFLFNSYLADRVRITLTVDVGHIPMDIDSSIPCGLIISELVSNALKYAFPDGRHGEITIRLTTREDGKISLLVADNGVGLPPGLDFRNTETLGLQLVTMLTKQLRGQIGISGDHGTSWEITFSATGNGKSGSV
ncbi:MAG: PAS domain S-box protein [Desulfuromonadales bacterium]|nr:PAS domain S-box protein [Desulfuromonadales bacterium]